MLNKLLSSLFDLSFSSFITTKIIKLIYLLAIGLIGLTLLMYVGRAFGDGVGSGMFALILGTPISLVFVVYVRVFLEVVIVLFRTMENTREVADRLSAMSPTDLPADS